MKIGLFGGTFNPIHNGHLIIAGHVLSEYKLDYIYFIPTFKSLYKITDIEIHHRKKLVQLGIKNNSHFKLNDVELKNKEISYTYNTLSKICSPENKYYLIIGNEWLPKFKEWYHYKKIFNYSHLIVVKRDFKKTHIPGFLKNYQSKIHFARNPVIELSSTMIRRERKKGKDIEYYIPDNVLKYIKKNNLYQ